MKMQFRAFNTATAKSRKCHIYLAGRDHQQSLSNSFSVQEVRFFSFKILIMSYKKLCRKQPVEFLITEHIFF